jgi:streptogramin lyase
MPVVRLLRICLAFTLLCLATPILQAGTTKRSDFNGNGTSDLLWRNGTTGQVYLMPMNGATVLGGAVIWTEANPAWQIVGTGDFDGDGKADILWWNSSTGQVFQMLMNGTTVKSSGMIYQEPNTAWTIQAIADFTGDSKADILWRNSSTGQVYLMPMNGATVLAGAVIHTEANLVWQIVGAGDFNGDGKAEILWWHSGTGQAYLMRTNSLSAATGAVIYTEPNTAWKIVGGGDFNGDGTADILWRNTTTGQVYLMPMLNGAPQTGGIVWTEPNMAWQIMAIGDFDGDGKDDMVWRNSQTGQIYQMLMNGTAIKSQGMIYTEPNTAWTVQGGGTQSQVGKSGATSPAITTQPSNQTVTAGQSATFSVVASGTLPLSYQWQRSNDGGTTWTNVTTGTGGTAASYTTGMTTISDSGAKFRAMATNSAGSVNSNMATLTVNASPVAPSITTQPLDQSVTAGQTATFTAAASGTPTPSYQWQRSNDGGTTWANVTAGTGGTTTSYTTAATVIGDNAARFRTVVTNSVNAANSYAARLTVAAPAPSLSAVLPVQQLIQVTKEAVLTPTVSGGTAPFTYAWSKDGAAIPGATGASFSVPSLRLADQGAYQVRVTDGAGASATASSKLFVATTADLPTGLNPVGVATSGDDVYLTSPGLNLILKLNRYSNRTQVVPVAGGPTGITVDAAGNPWVALNTSGQIAKIDKGTLAVTAYTVGGQPFGITKGLSNDLWFTIQGTSQIAKLSTSGGTPTYYALSASSSPAGLSVGADGTVWFTERDLGQVGRIAPGATQAEEWKCPHDGARPEQILATPDGNVFYTDRNAGAVVKFTIGSQATGSAVMSVEEVAIYRQQEQEWAVARRQPNLERTANVSGKAMARNQAALQPTIPPALGLVARGALNQAFAYGMDKGGSPAGITVDASGYVWLTQQGLGKVSRLAGDGSIYTYTLPSSQSQPVGITIGSDGAVYTALAGTNQVAQIPAVPQPITVAINAKEPRRMLKGETQTYTATVTGAMDSSVTWELLEGAAAGTITQGGAYTTTTTPGTYHLLARSVQDPSKFGRLEVVVYPWAKWPQGQLALLAGNVEGPGNVDGQGSAARFFAPDGVAVDYANNVYVADGANFTIRKISSTGIVSTLAGASGLVGAIDGQGGAARFVYPRTIAVDPAGNVYVGDSNDYTYTLRKITPGGAVVTLAGKYRNPGAADGIGSQAQFWGIGGLAFDGIGNIYVSDYGNHTIRKVSTTGLVTTIAGLAGQYGSTDGPGSAARFNLPWGLAVDSTGNLFVADAGNATIRKITPAGVVSTLAGMAGQGGVSDGLGSAARFANITGMSIDAAGNLYVADLDAATIRKITPLGLVTTLAGMAGLGGSSDGLGSAARFWGPRGVSVDSSGNVFVAEEVNNTIRKVTPSGVVSTVAGTPGQAGTVDGTGAASRFNAPRSVAIDISNNAYVTDFNDHTIRKITPAGDVITLAGSPGLAGSADGQGSAARFIYPQGVALDSSGNLYVADNGNHTIRKITPAGYVTTLAGLAGQNGNSDGMGSAARFYNPCGVVVDAAGNIFVADGANSTIRKITPSGLVTTFAGSGAWSSVPNDGPGTAATFNWTRSIAIDTTGNLYVGDYWNMGIRKITPDGVVSTLSGARMYLGFGYNDGTASAALFHGTTGVAVDANNNVYVTDEYNNAIRMVTPDGFTGTILGDITAGINRPGLLRGGVDLPLPSNYGALTLPQGIAVGPNGNLYVTTANGVMKVTFTP